MTPKEYLKQYRETLACVRSMDNHREILQTECDILKRQNGERIRLDAAVAHLVDMDTEIERQTDRMKHLWQEISRIILSVPNPVHRALLTAVYIDGRTLADTAREMHYSYRNMTRLHGHALQKVGKILEEEKLS